MTPQSCLARLRALADQKRQGAALARQQAGLHQEEIAAELLREAWALDWAVAALGARRGPPAAPGERAAR